MNKEPKKMDRRKFIYAGLGALVVIFGGIAAYFATRPPEKVVETIEKTVVSTISGTPTTVVKTETKTLATTVEKSVTVGKPKIRALYMSTYAPALNDWLKARTFEWAAKKGVDVELSMASYMEIVPKILTGVEAGNPPDIVFGSGSLIALMAEDPKSRHLASIDDVINEIGKEDIIEPVKRWYTIDGNMYAIDFFLFVNVVHLIKSFAKEVGRKPEELDTWEDYIEFAREVKRKHPDKYPMGFTLGRCWDGCETWHMFWWPYGGKFITERSVAGIKYKSKESVETAARVLELFNEGLLSPELLRADEMLNNNTYLTRTAAFICEGPTPYYAAVTRNPALAADTVLQPAPRGPAGRFTWGSKEAMCIFKESKNVDLAKDLLVHIFKDRDAYYKMIKSGYYAAYPIFKSVGEKLKAEDPVWARYVDVVAPTIVDYTYPLNQPCKAADEVISKFIFADVWSDMMIDKKDPEEAVNNTYEKIKEIVLRVYGK